MVYLTVLSFFLLMTERDSSCNLLVKTACHFICRLLSLYVAIFKVLYSMSSQTDKYLIINPFEFSVSSCVGVNVHRGEKTLDRGVKARIKPHFV